MIGHLLGAAGAVEAAVTALTIHEGIIHPTINREFPDPECDLDYVPDGPRRAQIRYALSNSFGFGGTNACLLLKNFTPSGKKEEVRSQKSEGRSQKAEVRRKKSVVGGEGGSWLSGSWLVQGEALGVRRACLRPGKARAIRNRQQVALDYFAPGVRASRMGNCFENGKNRML